MPTKNNITQIQRQGVKKVWLPWRNYLMLQEQTKYLSIVQIYVQTIPPPTPLTWGRFVVTFCRY